MTAICHHQFFESDFAVSQSLCNDRCQNILYKAVFEHFTKIKNVAALLLASKSFQNSSFGANFVVNFVVDEKTILLIDSVLSPSSCFSLQFAPSLHIKQSARHSEKINLGISNFVDELAKTKYFHLSLRSLTLDSVTNEDLSRFFGSSSSNFWTQLQDLNLEKCGVDDTVLKVIAANALQLRNLSFSESWGINDSSLEYVSKLSSITSLDLTYCYLITDAAMEHVVKLTGIRSLNLSCCFKLTDACVEHVAELISITSLNLSGCDNITDAGLERISQLSGITTLDLYNCSKITDFGLEHIVKLSSITSLNLSYCNQITDAGLEHISKLSCIRSLNLDGCAKITDAGLEHLTKLVGIKSLNLYVCGKISAESKLKFNAAMPNCKILC